MSGPLAVAVLVGAGLLALQSVRRAVSGLFVVFDDPVDDRLARHRDALGPRSVP